MYIAFTTVAKDEDAVVLAEGLIAQRLAVCVQVDGPIRSHFIWEGKASWEPEFRLMIKLLREDAAKAREWVLQHHPYQNPEWLVIEADQVAEKYLSWARGNRNS